MRRNELAGTAATRRIGLNAGDQIALQIEDTEPGSDIRQIDIDRQMRPDFTDEAQRALAAGHEQSAGTVQIVPLRLELAVAVEHLNAVILAVGDIDPAVGIATNIMRDVELAGQRAGPPQENSSFPSGAYLCTREFP